MNLTDKNLEWLQKMGLPTQNILWDLPPDTLVEHTVNQGEGGITSTGALAIKTGKFTGRSPKDRFIVQDDITKDNVWWGDVNKPFDSAKFDALYNKMVKSFDSDSKLYVYDALVGAEEKFRKNLRIVSPKPWLNLFVYNMFLRLTDFENFETEWTIINSPEFKANPKTDGTANENFVIIDFTRKIILEGGTGYTGEIKKAMFSILNFLYPIENNILPMHSSANIGTKNDTAIFFGLSGTGKTTLSTDPNRRLIGDDEHGWTPEGNVFNYEGGCYAKVINLSEKDEPDIFYAIKKGALLENVMFKKGTNEVDYSDKSITENIRVSYPIHHIKNIEPTLKGDNVKNIFFLTADAFGVLPPISLLNLEQAAYFFISGYTAKVAGTEMGITEPIPSFSACFGAPFLPLHPFKYADMLKEKMAKYQTKVWLVNTGWIGGAYGVGSRIKLRYTRALLTAALEGKLDESGFNDMPVFDLKVPKTCPNVPTEILFPRDHWQDKKAYDEQLLKLKKFFDENYKKIL